MKRELIAILLAFSALLFITACGGDASDPDDIDAILNSADIANDVMTLAIPKESTLYYQTCMPLPLLRADGQNERMKNNPEECDVVATSLCGYWMNGQYTRATGPGCDMVECVKAAGKSFSEFIGSYETDGTKTLSEEYTNAQCTDAPISKAVPHTGKFTAEARLYTDAACQKPVTATAEFNN